MQTFLPYADFKQSAKALDRQRLGKQRVEVLQLLKALAGESKGWSNHPAAIMWRGSERKLIEYGIVMCEEWKSRGYKDTCTEKIAAYGTRFAGDKAPEWLGDATFHRSHQSNLIRKLPEHYMSRFGNVPADLPYVWPNEARSAK